MAQFLGATLTNRGLSPATINSGQTYAGAVYRAAEVIEIADTANADTTILLEVPTDGFPFQLFYASDDLTSGTSNIGLFYESSPSVFTAVDDDCFATLIAQGSGAVARADVILEAAATNISKLKKTFWEWGGLSARPAYEKMYIGIANATGTGATGTVSLECFYTKG